MNMRIVLWSGALAALVLVACKKDPDDKPLETGYPEAVEKVLTDRGCMGCHNAERREGDFAMDTWDHLFQGVDERGALVFPYNADWSHLLWHLRHDSTWEGQGSEPYMPYTAAGVFDAANKLTYAEYKTLYDWVAQGAVNAQGQRKWQDRESSGAGKWFFLNQGSDLLGVLDLATGLVMRYVNVGKDDPANQGPHYCQLSPDGQYLYISLINGGYIEKYRTSDYGLVARSANLGSAIAHVEVSGDGKWLVASNWTDLNENKLVILNANDLSLNDQLADAFLQKPHGIALRRDFTRLWVGSNAGNYFWQLDLNPTTGKFLPASLQEVVLDGTVAANNGIYKPYQLLLDPDEERLFITCNQAGNPHVFLYDVTGNSPIYRDASFGDAGNCFAGLGETPGLMSYYQGKLYVSCENQLCTAQQGGLKGCISVLNVGSTSLSWERNIYEIGSNLRSLSIDPVRQRLYVVGANFTGAVPPHHLPEGATGNPGHFNVVSLNGAPQVLFSSPIDVGVFPTGSQIIP